MARRRGNLHGYGSKRSSGVDEILGYGGLDLVEEEEDIPITAEDIEAANQEYQARRYSNGTLYDSSMGNVQGGGVTFKRDGTNHQTYYGDGLRVSHDVAPDGRVSNVHPTDQNASKGDPNRHLGE